MSAQPTSDIRKTKTSPLRKRPSRTNGARLQVALGWSVLGLVLASTLWNGAFPPVIWVLLCILIGLLFAVQVSLDVVNGVPLPGRRALWLGVIYFTVVAWLLMQTNAGMPPGVVHPFWSIAPTGAVATISAQPDGGWQIAMRFTCYAMCFWIILRSTLASTNGGMGFISAIALFSTALAIYGMVSIAAGQNVLLGAEENITPMRASFWNRNTYATFAVFGVLANVCAYLNAMSVRVSREGLFGLRDALETFFNGAWIYGFGMLIGVGAVAMTVSRGGAVAGIVGYLILIATVRGGAVRKNYALMLIPLAIFAFALVFLSAEVGERLSASAGDARWPIFRSTIEGILDRPLLGHGAGAYLVAFRPYVPPKYSFVEWQSAHNSYLENAFEFGLPAAALLYLALALIGWRLKRGAATRKRHQLIPVFALACLSAAAVHALVDFSLSYPAVAALLAAILGMGWAQSFAGRGPKDR